MSHLSTCFNGKSTKMEPKANKNSHVLMFGLSFNLILTLGSLGFTCYSLHRSSKLDLRLTSLEQNLLLTNPLYQLSNSVIVEPTSAHTHPSGSLKKETARVRRAAERPTVCRKCKTVCVRSNGQRRASFLVLYVSQMPLDPLSNIVNSSPNLCLHGFERRELQIGCINRVNK